VSQTARLVFIVVASVWLLLRAVLAAVGFEPLGWSIAFPLLALWVTVLMYCREANRGR